ncbi:hypothetical protein OAT97_00870 [Gammaproteobacteria bacterium]|nr:hypothetical protein [Gammaproteobacteria bacterium]
MKKYLILLMIISVSGMLAWLMSHDSGQVALSYSGINVSTSLWTALSILIMGYLLLVLVKKILVACCYYLSLQSWRQTTKANKQQQHSQYFLDAVIQDNNWQEVYVITDNPELSSDYHKLCAAYIAYKAADHHLALQYVQGMLVANYTSSLLLADIYLHQKQWDLAVLALKKYIQDDSQAVLERLLKIYIAKQKWSQALAVLERIIVAITPSQRGCHFSKQYLQVLTAYLQEQTVTKNLIKSIWQALDTSLQANAAICMQLVQKLETPAHDLAFDIISLHLSQDPSISHELLAMYPQLKIDTARLIATANKWLNQSPQSAPLQLVLSRLYANNQEWHKSLAYVQNAWQLEKSIVVVKWYLKVLKKLEDNQAVARLVAQLQLDK